MKKHPYEYIKSQFEKEGYKLLSKKYIDALSKLKAKCPNGHNYKVKYGNFYQGQRCPICYGNKKLTYEYVKEQIEKVGYKLLSDEYINVKTKLKVKCSEGHIYYVKYNNFQQGQKCPICLNKHRGSSQQLSYSNVKKQIEKSGYKLLSKEYKNHGSMINICCPKGHSYYVKYNNFQQGQRCPICWNINNYSRSEKDCLNVVKQFTNENVIENDRTQLVNPKTGKYLELDVWIPSLKKAIEFNGEYWHKNNYKDNVKIEQCKKRDIDLIIIWYNDWMDDKQKVIENITKFLGEAQ